MRIDYDKDQLAYALANALKERDEARDIGEKLSKQGLDMMDKNRSLSQELDKAREALMRIEDLFLDGTDIYADRENMGLIARAALEETK